MTPRGPGRGWTGVAAARRSAVRSVVASVASVVASSILFVASASTAHAADPAAPPAPTYAIASLIGDALSVVTYRQSVGSGRDQNAHQSVPLPDRDFDRLALVYAADAIRRSAPAADTLMLRVTDTATVGSSDTLMASTDRFRAFLDPIASALQPRGTRYLLVVTKFRGDARMQMADGKVGSGKLSGLGFYLDDRLKTRNRSTGERGTGFIAPFVYIEVSLVDLATSAVLRSETATESRALSSARSASGVDPWEALDADAKSRLLDGLLRRALDTAVPHVVAPG